MKKSYITLLSILLVSFGLIFFLKTRSSDEDSSYIAFDQELSSDEIIATYTLVGDANNKEPKEGINGRACKNGKFYFYTVGGSVAVTLDLYNMGIPQPPARDYKAAVNVCVDAINEYISNKSIPKD